MKKVCGRGPKCPHRFKQQHLAMYTHEANNGGRQRRSSARPATPKNCARLNEPRAPEMTRGMPPKSRNNQSEPRESGQAEMPRGMPPKSRDDQREQSGQADMKRRRTLMEEQDAAYQDALNQELQREIEEAEIRLLQEQAAKERASRRQQLMDSQPESSGGVRVKIRLPTGTTFIRTFDFNDGLDHVRRVVELEEEMQSIDDWQLDTAPVIASPNQTLGQIFSRAGVVNVREIY